MRIFVMVLAASVCLCFGTSRAAAEFEKSDKSQVLQSPAKSKIFSVESKLHKLSKTAADYEAEDARKYIRAFNQTKKYVERDLSKLTDQDPNWNTRRYRSELKRLEVLHKRALADLRATYTNAGYKNIEKRRVERADGAPEAKLPPASWCQGVEAKPSYKKMWAERPDNFAGRLAGEDRPLSLFCIAPKNKLVQTGMLVALQRVQNKSFESTRLTIARARLRALEIRNCGSTKWPHEVDYLACNERRNGVGIRMWWWNGTPSQQTPLRNFAIAAALVGKNLSSYLSAQDANRYLMAEQILSGLTFEKLERQLEKEWQIGMLSGDKAKQLIFAEVLAEFESIERRMADWKAFSRDLSYLSTLKSIAKKARGEWEAATRSPDFATLLEFEAAYFAGRAPSEECAGTLRAIWNRYLKKRAPKDKEGLIAAVGNPLGARILIDRGICAMAGGHKTEALSYVTLLGLGGNLNHFSPDYYASQRIMEAAANGQVRGKKSEGFGSRQGDQVSMRSAMGQIESESLFGERLQFDKRLVRKAALKHAKKAGAVHSLTFKTMRYKARVPYKCKKTRRIYRIHSDGRIEYEQNCKYKTVTKKMTPTPIAVTGLGDCKLKRGDKAIVTAGYGGERPLVGIVRGKKTVCVGGSVTSNKVFADIEEEI